MCRTLVSMVVCRWPPLWMESLDWEVCDDLGTCGEILEASSYALIVLLGKSGEGTQLYP